MKAEIIKLAHHRLMRAEEAFQEAVTLLAAQSPNGSMNRFYYAAFYAARSLLALKNLDSSKHSGVISLFHQHFVKTGEFNQETAKTLSRSFEERQDSDYEDFITVTIVDAERLRDQVRIFVDECGKILGSHE